MHLLLEICYNKTCTCNIVHDKNKMSLLIIQSTYQGQVKSSHQCFIIKAVLKNFAIFTGKCLCWGLFLIENFKATLLKRDSNAGVYFEYCQIFKISCFEEHLLTAASIRCYLDLINLKLSGFAKPILLKFLFQNKNIKIITKTVNLKKKKKKERKKDKFSILISISRF